MTYLGIQIVSQLKNIPANNYILLLQEISKLLNRWIPITMSLTGKIHVLKMNILPKLLDLYQNLPIHLYSLSYKRFLLHSFGIIDILRHDSHYYTHPWTELALNVLIHFATIAAQLRAFIFYFTEGDAPLWKEMDEPQLNLSIPTWVYSAKEKKTKKDTKKILW